ncbi:FAD-dependent oxidoreductase [Nocardia sp. NPDC055321]
MPTLTLVDRRREYDLTHLYRFRPARPIRFAAGQYGHLMLPGPVLGLSTNIRELSIASSPLDETIDFLVDGSSNSRYQYTLRTLEPGAQVRFFGVHGTLVLPEFTTTPVVLIGGGVGMAPFRSMVRFTAQRRPTQPVTVVQVASRGTLCAEEYEASDFPWHRCDRGTLGEVLLGVAAANPNARYYVAGPPAMLKTTRELLIRHGIDRRAIGADSFTGLTRW